MKPVWNNEWQGKSEVLGEKIMPVPLIHHSSHDTDTFRCSLRQTNSSVRILVACQRLLFLWCSGTFRIQYLSLVYVIYFVFVIISSCTSALNPKTIQFAVLKAFYCPFTTTNLWFNNITVFIIISFFIQNFDHLRSILIFFIDCFMQLERNVICNHIVLLQINLIFVYLQFIHQHFSTGLRAHIQHLIFLLKLFIIQCSFRPFFIKILYVWSQSIARIWTQQYHWMPVAEYSKFCW